MCCRACTAHLPCAFSLKVTDRNTCSIVEHSCRHDRELKACPGGRIARILTEHLFLNILPLIFFHLSPKRPCEHRDLTTPAKPSPTSPHRNRSMRGSSSRGTLCCCLFWRLGRTRSSQIAVAPGCSLLGQGLWVSTGSSWRSWGTTPGTAATSPIAVSVAFPQKSIDSALLLIPHR